MTAKTNLTINPQRLWDQIIETAKFGGTPKGGIKRLTLSDEDKKVRDWFKAQCQALGCTVSIDACGNMPEIETILIEDPEPLGPYGAKGIGEPALIPTAPAILSAIENATGVRITRVPATPDRVFAALKANGVGP